MIMILKRHRGMLAETRGERKDRRLWMTRNYNVGNHGQLSTTKHGYLRLEPMTVIGIIEV
ncbi:hypothetical protein PM082_009374 [Marasmius tenuissimus]|nr:hypothetical protein PM082_009374 [Marasmius tenuissimus]